MKLKEIRELLEKNKAITKIIVIKKAVPLHVLHKTKSGDTIPAIIKCISGGKPEKFVLIEGDFLDSPKSRWVKANTLALQEKEG